MSLIKSLITFVLLFVTLSANALNLGQILSGTGRVGEAWNEEEQRQLQNYKLQLEVERMNRDAEIQKLEYQKKIQTLPQNNADQYQDLHSFQKELSTKLPIIIDKDTILLSTIIESQKAFKFVYQLTNLQKSMISTADFWNKIQPHLSDSTCANEYWGVFIRSGGAVLYHYLDRENNYLSTIIINSCRH